MTLSTQHPTAGELARYAVADEERSQDVRKHLESGCGVCLLAIRRLQEIVAMTEAVPAPAVRDWIVPKRIAFHQGGLRGSALADVQMICTVGSYELDLLVRETDGPERSLEIVGQVTRAGRVFEPVADLPLALVEARTREDTARAETDEFGEFDVSSPCGNTYGLRLGASADAPCILVWGGSVV